MYLESLYGLLQDFTWCIPSAYYNAVPDVSLFDHARTTAALAACLAADGRDNDWCQEVMQALRQERNDGAAAAEVCLLVGADINGVQAFIYTLTSEGAAKGLRARSFYLQLLTEAVARFVLDRLGLPVTNLLYAGGGVFQLLAPLNAATALVEARAEVAARLLKIHGGALGLVLEWTPVRACEFENMSEPRRRLSGCIAQAKRRPFSAVAPEQLAQYVGAALEFDQGGDVKSACKVCGTPDPQGEKCALCRSMEELGQNLPRATHLVACDVPPVEARRVRSWQEGLRAFGLDMFVVGASALPELVVGASAPPELVVGASAPPELVVGASAPSVRIWRLSPCPPSNEATLLEQIGNRPHVIAYRPFAQLTPQRWNREESKVEIATFDHLAEESARGIERWGVLRMDVDNLGDLFLRGFERPTLSRTASLSLALQLFFEGHLPTIGAAWNEFSAKLRENKQPHVIWGTKEQPGPRDKLYIQYAGGDDLFVVGAWDALPEFAAAVRRKFACYTCNNPAVTLSAGVALADAKFPLYQAAEWAGDAEEAAKRFEREDGRSKDAVAFLDQTVGWEQFETIQKRAADLARWCESRAAPRALIQLLLTIDAEWRRGWKEQMKGAQHKKPKYYFGRWMWQLVYYLTRAAERSKQREVIDGIGEMERAMLDQKEITTIGLTARRAELLIRK